MKNRILILLLTILPFFAYGQKRGNVWTFGHQAAFDFNGAIPVPVSSTLISRGSCVSICDTHSHRYSSSNSPSNALVTNYAKIFPSPSKGNVNLNYTLEGENLFFRLYDISGKIIFNLKLSSKKNMENIDLSHISPGLYN